VGRLLAHKGIDRLICALPPDLPCVLAGRAYDPAYAEYLRALASGRDITFIEDADDLAVRDLYQRAWATVLPSVHLDAWGRIYEAPELMGFSALESMACGTPTLVSPTAALPEFVRQGKTGFVCNGLGELAERCTAFAGGGLDADALGANARTLIEAEYSIEVAGRKLSIAYDELLQ
jgi:glycosyltransferase involved in cell wall biosynthesis